MEVKPGCRHYGSNHGRNCSQLPAPRRARGVGPAGAGHPAFARAPEALQVGAQIGGAGVAQVAILFQGLGQNRLHGRRQSRVKAQRRRRFVVQDLVGDEGGGCAAERGGTGRHFIEHGAERKQVGAGIQFLATHLLGRHVGEGADDRSGDRKRLGATCGGQVRRAGQLARRRLLGQTEIQNLGPPVTGDEEVGGFEVAMDDASGVRGLQRIGKLDCPAQQVGQGQRPAGDAFAQRGAIEVLHRNVSLSVGFAQVVNGADIGVVETRGRLRFAPKAGEGARITGDRGRQELERDLTIEPDVFRQVDLAHAAAAELAHDAVVADDRPGRERTAGVNGGRGRP